VSRLFLRNSISRAIPILMAPESQVSSKTATSLKSITASHRAQHCNGNTITLRKFPPLIEQIFACGGLPEFARQRYLAETR
jgi:hypothetical protein